jgi:hypothetical protein
VRAFHIMDPKGVLDTLLVFHEKQGTLVLQPLIYSSDDPEVDLFSAEFFMTK